MKKAFLILFVFSGIIISSEIMAQVNVKTLTGSSSGYNDGNLNSAKFSYPYDVWIDSTGNTFITDTKNQRIRKISTGSNSSVTTIAGNGTSGSADGKGSFAEFNDPKGIVGDKSGNLYITDSWNNRIRKITPGGDVSTLALTGVKLNEPIGITIDKSQNLYVADFLNHRIVLIDSSGNSSVIAGTGFGGYKDGAAASAEFYGPTGIAIDDNKNIYVAEFFGNKIRKISNTGIVSTIAGTGANGFKNGAGKTAVFSEPHSIKIQDSFLYVTDRGNSVIRMININSGNVSTYAGIGYAGYLDGPASKSAFNYPQGFFLSKNGDITLADNLNHKIRLIESDKPVIKPIAGFTAQDVCEGNEMLFINTSTISGGGQLSYKWDFGNGDSSILENPGVIYTAAGTYNVTLIAFSANQTSDTFTKIVNVFANPDGNFSSSISGRSVAFTPLDTTHSTYFWYFGDGMTSNQVNPQYTYNKDSTYIVRLVVKNKNGCESEHIDTIVVQTTTGLIGETNPEFSITVFPNPFQENTNITYHLEKPSHVQISIYDLSGKEVKLLVNERQNKGDFNVFFESSYSTINKGMYLIRFIIDDNIYAKQIIKVN